MKQEPQKSSRIREVDKNKNREFKLPKLVISQFNGNSIQFSLDCFRFQNQFKTQIGKLELSSSVTKLSYLKEMVIPKVQLLIDGLPWNTEGYERVKNILPSKFGKLSELTNAHFQYILSLHSTKNEAFH